MDANSSTKKTRMQCLLVCDIVKKPEHTENKIALTLASGRNLLADHQANRQANHHLWKVWRTLKTNTGLLATTTASGQKPESRSGVTVPVETPVNHTK